MIVLQTIFVAFSMFSALPTPQFEWNSRNMRYMMCALPLIGVVCGGGWWIWSAVCGYFPVPALLRGAVLCLIPVLVTGGIHLDGYADTCDALASHAEPAKKQEILKDPRCGAFAVIRLCSYFVAHLALCTALELTAQALWCMSLAFLLERALSGWRPAGSRWQRKPAWSTPLPPRRTRSGSAGSCWRSALCWGPA